MGKNYSQFKSNKELLKTFFESDDQNLGYYQSIEQQLSLKKIIFNKIKNIFQKIQQNVKIEQEKVSIETIKPFIQDTLDVCQNLTNTLNQDEFQIYIENKNFNKSMIKEIMNQSQIQYDQIQDQGQEMLNLHTNSSQQLESSESQIDEKLYDSGLDFKFKQILNKQLSSPQNGEKDESDKNSNFIYNQKQEESQNFSQIVHSEKQQQEITKIEKQKSNDQKLQKEQSFQSIQDFEFDSDQFDSDFEDDESKNHKHIQQNINIENKKQLQKNNSNSNQNVQLKQLLSQSQIRKHEKSSGILKKSQMDIKQIIEKNKQSFQNNTNQKEQQDQKNQNQQQQTNSNKNEMTKSQIANIIKQHKQNQIKKQQLEQIEKVEKRVSNQDLQSENNKVKLHFNVKNQEKQQISKNILPIQNNMPNILSQVEKNKLKNDEKSFISEGEWFRILNESIPLSQIDPEKVKMSFIKGLPQRLRRRIWTLYVYEKGAIQLKQNEFEQLYLIDSCMDEQINKDLDRTKLNCSFTKIPLWESHTQLFKILRAYANLDPEIGYIQGLNNIAMSILMTMSDYQEDKINQQPPTEIMQRYDQISFNAFSVFVYIMQDMEHKNLLLSNTQQLIDKILSFDTTLKQIYQKIYEHFNSFNVNGYTLYTHYFITLLSYSASQKFVERVFDLYLIKGQEVIDYLLLKMIEGCQDKIMKIKDATQIFKFIKYELCDYYFEKNKYSFDKLFQ
ncbi:Rab-GTPase-TBC domain [Pseudocohnilembus persalinus]|uniref:Rab-GTPase-TBC domain n=1 Tax=Pseudocohnilembus persalinus TaxID=266149 RepID=A0A0V0R206_PSEPJ|nr:Rab-GTPase-TBC domain [Pseudocohnilembus persalinus]|eukprot:KRX08553.1 Rab-GTPase-TBC domain [Pseudocohnilembus persalinus]